MVSAWRLVKEKHAATAFDGDGAAKFGGRWNSPRVRVVYASATLSLAALETLVHLNPLVLFRYVAFGIDFDDSLLEKTSIESLPANWKAEPPASSSQVIGDRWALEARTAVLAVPSVIVPGETNYLLNPSHRDFRKISIGRAEPFAFDPRLLT